MSKPRRLSRYRAWGKLLALSYFTLAAGCHAFHFTPLTNEMADKTSPAVVAPGKRPAFRVSQFVFYADFDIDRRLPIFAELANLRDQVYKELQLPSANTVVHVYLFEDRQRYERFMKAKYENLPYRRAFFVAQPRAVGSSEDLLVFTFWGDRIQEDLRHELTHALLHSVLRDVPLWLDEGLAEYFEVPPGWRGINYQHLDHLLHDAGTVFRPDLARLETLTQVDQMSPREYRESWAWVHFMLHSRPEAKQVLVKYLQELRTTATPGLLRPRLAGAVPELDGTVQNHVAALDASPRPLAATSR
jgi:hypothetical protein